MAGDLRADIKQRKPFASLEEEALLNLARTAAVMAHAFGEALRPYGVTDTQYNVLRILRGAGPDGLCRNEIRDRMIAQVPDVTRLLDRLVQAELVERQRNAEDRRQVGTRITAKGLSLLDELDGPVLATHREHLGHMSHGQLSTLIELLTFARERI